MKIQAYALLSDNGDGGYTVRLFPTIEEMEEFQKDIAECTGRKFDVTDEYSFGYRSFENPITLEIDDNGQLVKKVCLGFGQ